MPITGHPFHPTGSQIVAHLERLAANEANGLHGGDAPSSTQSQTPNTSTPSQRIGPNTTNVASTATDKPPCKRSKTKTKSKTKRNKRKRNDNGSGTETEEEPTFDPTGLKNSDKTVVQLRYLAEKYASSCMTDAILESVLEFHEELQTMIAIKALELGTTVSAIEVVFGKYIGVRRPSRWNQFLQSPRARTVFKAGVGSGEGMQQLSAMWKSMTEEEKDVYKEAVQEMDSTDLQAMDEDLAGLESGTNTVINPQSLKKYKDNTENYLDDVMKNVMVIVAVSTHISNHSFQMTRSTVGIQKVVKEIYAIDGVNNFASEVQAHLVGRKPGELSKTKSEWLLCSQVIVEVTGLKHWPWSKCDATLKEAGFQLELLKGARLVEGTFKVSSSNLNRAKLLALESNLQNNFIYLAPINQSTTAPNQNQRIKNTENPTDPTTTTHPLSHNTLSCC
ncbi:hypothetical protein DFH28DRAFT_1084203 [Melampsora americana]|nr:hypothetical protein DFH28DRAFT_1084203 [Melampsora americana]